MAERLKLENFEEKAFLDQKLSLIEFYSDSCIPCKVLSPILSQLEQSYAQQLFVGKVNVAYESELVEKYGVMSAPTIVFIKNKEVISRFTGLQSKETLEAVIRENIES
jgi:thioredoxin 1